MTEQRLSEIRERIRTTIYAKGVALSDLSWLLDEVERLKQFITDADMDGCCCKFEDDGETHKMQCAVHAAWQQRAESAEKVIKDMRVAWANAQTDYQALEAINKIVTAYDKERSNG